MLRTSIALYHLRRRHHHRWRNIWGKYPVLPWDHLVRVVPCRQERRRCRAGQQGRVGLCYPRVQGYRLVRVLRFDQVVRVDQLLRWDQARRALMGCRRLGCREVPCLRPCLDRRVVRWVRVDRVVRYHHPCQGRQVDRWGQVRQARQVDQRVRVVLVGKACRVEVALPSKSPMVGDPERLVDLEHQVCLVCRSFLAFLGVQEVRASSSCRNRPASWRSFGCVRRGRS